MRLEESRVIATWLQELPLKSGDVCLNIGSSDQSFGENRAFIHENVIAPLIRRGVTIVNCDLKARAGVDEVGDIFDEKYRDRLRKYKAKLLICANLLEHLAEPQRFMDACGSLLDGAGYCMVTVPRSYPYHPDPIDTMLRPSPSDLAAFLPNWKLVRAGEVEAGNHWTDIKSRSGSPVIELMRQLARVIMPMYKPHTWRAAAHRMTWLTRPFKVSLALLQKP